ncbi:RNF144A [Cordylochernes scorpioides]|uniref:RNF144A n=1 Tax=Cordylochernes scorpioides TaxID=51811 RepID=A0ABY6KCD2_9ARAC|nr:RNF144A [Cordylochernes scorpioides]
MEAMIIMCIQTYIEVKIKEGDVQIGCPDSSCRIQGQFQDDEIRSLLPNSLKYLYEKLKLNADLANLGTSSIAPSASFQLSILKDVLRWSVNNVTISSAGIVSNPYRYCSHPNSLILPLLTLFLCVQGDLFLRHYDEGPCKDKLGHPRIGLFVHRFGVSGTFWLIL